MNVLRPTAMPTRPSAYTAEGTHQGARMVPLPQGLSRASLRSSVGRQGGRQGVHVGGQAA